MKIMVAVKRVIDYAVKIRVKPDKTGVETSNVKMSMNPFCEIALEEAIRIKERGFANEIITVSVGPNQCIETLRSSLALGADRAIHVSTDDDNIQPLTVAKFLKEISQKEKPHLILLGKQAIDDDCNQTGQMTAALLNYPQATFASKIAIDEDKNFALVTREVDEGFITVKVKLPAVITADLRLNVPRYATLPNIMKAKKKVIQTILPEELVTVTNSQLKTLSVTEPPKRKAGVILSSVDELLDKLRNEAKVIA